MSDRFDALWAAAEKAVDKDGNWFLLAAPWLDRDTETMILAGSPDPHIGVMVCDFVDAAQAGVESDFTDEDWSARNWSLAEHIAAADPSTILALRDHVLDLRARLARAEAIAEAATKAVNAAPVGFFASVIQSGEDWSVECQAAYDKFRAAQNAYDAAVKAANEKFEQEK